MRIRSSLGEWQNVNEKYVTFPMTSPEDIYREMNDELPKI